MKKIYLFITCLLLVGAFSASAQYTRYIVQFTNKKGTPYTLSNPSAYLSAKAIARRNRYNIAIDSTDLPITPAYIDSILALPNVSFLNLSKWLNQLCIRITDTTGVLSKINSFSFVKKSNPIAVRRVTANPPVFNKLEGTPVPLRADSVNSPAGPTNYYSYGSNFPQVHIHNGEFLHNMGFHGEGMTIALLDAGFFNYLGDIALDSIIQNNQVLGTYDYVNLKTSVNEENAHGFWCLSTIATNRPGIMVGTCPKAKFWLLKTEDVYSEYPVEEQNWAAAAEYVDSAGADLISTSLGYSDFDDPSFNQYYPQRDGHTALATVAANMAVAKGMIVTASAGNSGDETTDEKYVQVPADGDSVLAVGASDVNGNIGSFSSVGPNYSGAVKPDAVSVGWNAVVASSVTGDPAILSGTSFSNPNLAGLVTCLWQAFPEMNSHAIRDAIQKSGNKYTTPDIYYGYGIPDMKRAFCSLVVATFKGTLSTNACASTLNWTCKDNNTLYYRVQRKTPLDTGFITIDTVNGKSPAFQYGSYSYTDTVKGLVTGQVAYRLQEVFSTDTTLILFNTTNTIITPCFSLLSEFTVSPNPFQNLLYVNINTDYTIQHLGIELIDMKGNTVYQYGGTSSSGKFNLAIPAGNLAAGIYVITIRDGKKILYSKKLLR
ncbi:MAG TPA: S8 family serine peptidase [Chitinophagaceae bacterium]|jgi:hypothetical protein